MYLNSYYNIISTSEDTTNTNRNIQYIMANVAQAEQIVRENSTKDNKVEIIVA